MRPLCTRLAAIVLSLGSAACASGGARVTSPSTSVHPVAVRVFDTRASRFVTFDEMITRTATADVVYFGEQHDDPATHAAEHAVMGALAAKRGAVTLTLEMFERDVQPLLDQYLLGTISEANFLAGSRPWERYTTDYRALVELARIRGWPVVAGNVPRRIASAVSRGGLAVLDTMARVDRAFSAAQNVCPTGDDAYYKKFAATMTGHSAGGGPPTAGDAAQMARMTDRFYEAQCIKDETMAESIASALAKHPGQLVLHIDGAFHSDGGLGTAARVLRRAPQTKQIVLSAVPIADLAKAEGAPHAPKGDYILFTRAAK
jgi:uncharacterized iron-regulated protein